MRGHKTVQRSGQILKSSTPTKSKSAQKKVLVQKKAQKKNGKNKTYIVLIIIGIIVAVVLLYLFFGGKPSETDVAVVSKNGTTEASDSPEARKPQEPLFAISKAKLKLESIDNKDIVRVIVEKSSGNDGNEISYKYDWSINGKPAGDGSDSLSGFKRGDKVAVKVTPFEGEKVGQSRVLEFSVQNTLPQVVDDKQFKYDGKSFSYKIMGTDPDGDVLTYSLAEAPRGMTIDPKTGVINWQLKDEDYGQHTINVKIADNKGGVTIYPVKIDLPKPTEEKKNEENKK